ncbi:MAG TPA: IPT/TIG domain-containing protein, partial [Puia sp.]|nr:IPT/TIG domain-containing protein [Puia sp.]
MSKPRILAPLSVALMFIFANTSCKKDQSSPKPPPIDTATTAITSIFPASASAGDTIKIRGRNLGVDISQFHLSLADSLPLQIYQAQDSFVSAILPSATRFGFFGTRQYHLGFARTSPTFSTTIDLGITCPQPKGWFQ